ncbi:hypothetical protein V6N12_056315 [Hibiscus sabdariffa]|uniref:Uncharacterized protein n=1 Tax=Hibiscus sabdariffa TaxID=183260 RepID=A0ABR2CSW6_9ROSI
MTQPYRKYILDVPRNEIVEVYLNGNPWPAPVTSDVPNRPNIKYSFIVPPNCPVQIYVNGPPPVIPGGNFPVDSNLGHFSFDVLFGNLVNELLPSFHEDEADSAGEHEHGLGGSEVLQNGKRCRWIVRQLCETGFTYFKCWADCCKNRRSFAYKIIRIAKFYSDLWHFLHMSCLIFLCLVLSFKGNCVLKFLKAPPTFSHRNSAKFVFKILGAANETCSHCSITCKLDYGSASDCRARKILYSGLQDGNHSFAVCMNGSLGPACSSYNWTVDTVPPTAYITSSTPFTNALNVSTPNSTFYVHYDRRSVFVDLRVHVPEKLLQLQSEVRTVQATNNYNNLKVYLYFSAPILNSSTEILSSLNISQGKLLPIIGEHHGNRRFGFMVANISNIAIITISLDANSTISRQGTPGYWFNWRVLLCALWVLFTAIFSLFLTWKCEGFRKPNHDTEETQQDTAGSLHEDETWRPCLKGIHPAWLMASDFLLSSRF